MEENNNKKKEKTKSRSSSSSSASREIWTRPARAMPWRAERDQLFGQGGHLVLLEPDKFKANFAELLDSLEAEREQWKGTGSSNYDSRIQPQSVEPLEKKPLEEAVPPGVMLVPSDRGDVILWRNPGHPLAAALGARPPGYALVPGDQKALEAQVHEEMEKAKKEGKEMGWDHMVHVLCLNYSGGRINHLIARAQAMAEASPTADQPLEEYINDQEYQPVTLEVFHGKHSHVVFEKVSFSGTMGEDGDQIRALSYWNKEVYLLCFPIDMQNYYNVIRNKFAIEVLAAMQSPLICLVGLAAEKREAQDKSALQSYITVEEGVQLAQRIGAAFYIECSEETGHGVLELFSEVALLQCQRKCDGKKGKDRCILQ